MLVTTTERNTKDMRKLVVVGAKKDGSAEKMERIIVTPEIAQAWLDKNTGNRKVKGRHVTTIARDMAEGRFVYTADPIRFDTDGRLIDGQHRLLACVKAGTPFETLVVYGLPPSVQSAIDTNAVRSPSDTLAMMGFHYTSPLAAAARLLYAERIGHSGVTNVSVSKAEILDIIERHKELPASVNDVRQRRLPVGIPPAQVAVVSYVGRHLLRVPDVAATFLNVMATGVPFYEGDAAHACRERLIRTSGGATIMNQGARWRLIKHSWNLFSAGQKMQQIRTPQEVWFTDLDRKLI